MDPNEKIQLDDITFDDVIGGDGVETTSIDEVAPPQVPEQDVEPVEENILDDIEIEDTSKQRKVEEEDKDTVEDTKDTKDTKDNEDHIDEDDDDSIVGTVLDKLGYEVDKTYDDTTEGLVQMTKDIASTIADERMEEVLEKFPLVKQHLQYVLEGGESQEFFNAHDPNLDYSKLTLQEDDIRSQKAILGDYLETKGHDNDFIKEMLEDFEDTGKLYSKAEAARKALGKYQETQRGQLLTDQRETQRQKGEELKEFWDGVANTIEESREFAGLRVTEKDKNAFFNYLSRPVKKDGFTQRDLDHQEADMETKLAIDYLMYKGFDLETLINTKARTKSVQTLKDRISKGEEQLKSSRRSSKRNTKFDIDNLDLNI
tara:strand:+ start:14 stop:1129 length:1116 start_codon:yes stop_codon:yes gene_type:complete